MPRTTRNSLSTPLAPSNRTPSHGNSPNTPNTTAGKRKQNNTPTPRSSASTKKRRLNSPYGTPTRQSRRIAHLTPENGLLEDYTSPRSLEKTFKDFTNILDHEDAEGEDDPKADAVACEKGAHVSILNCPITTPLTVTRMSNRDNLLLAKSGPLCQQTHSPICSNPLNSRRNQKP